MGADRERLAAETAGLLEECRADNARLGKLAGELAGRAAELERLAGELDSALADALGALDGGPDGAAGLVPLADAVGALSGVVRFSADAADWDGLAGDIGALSGGLSARKDKVNAAMRGLLALAGE